MQHRKRHGPLSAALGLLSICLTLPQAQGQATTLEKAAAQQGLFAKHKQFVLHYFTIPEDPRPRLYIKLSDTVTGHFIFDTGATTSLITQEMADKLPFPQSSLLDAGDNKPVLEEGKPIKIIRVPSAKIDTLQIPYPFVIVPASRLAACRGRSGLQEEETDMLLGMPELMRYRILLDYPDHKAYFLPVPNPANSTPAKVPPVR